jgi:membrane protease YdiL (CAAX protease family)
MMAPASAGAFFLTDPQRRTASVHGRLRTSVSGDSVRPMQRAFDRFIAPARAYPQLWRTALGAVLIVVGATVGTIVIYGAGWRMAASRDDGLAWLPRMLEADTPLGALLLLFSFTGMAVGSMLAARWLHRRPASTLFGPAVRTVRDFVRAALVVGALMLVSLALWSLGEDAVPNLPPVTWAALLPLTLLGLAIQTGAEEIAFRGYLQQQLGARFRSPLAWAIAPSLLFGLVHLNGDLPPGTAWTVVGAAAIFGLAAADLTARTGSIGAAWGFHFTNNVLAVAILSTDGTITGLSLFRTPYGVEDTMALDSLILLDLGFLVLAWWLVRRVVAR